MMSGSWATMSATSVQPHHLLEADALNRLDRHVEAALVLARQEALRNQEEQVDRAANQHERDRHRQRAMPQAQPQRPS